MNRILIVEDEKPISELIRLNLTDAGYACFCAYDGEQAATLLESNLYDLILLDVMLPKINGFELLEYIRPLQIPVIFLTAKAHVSDRVKGLRLGAEDYIIKPFEIIELLARVETVLRRYHKANKILSVYDITVDTLSRIVKKSGEPVSLTVKEYDLLVLFLQNPNIEMCIRDRYAASVVSMENTFGAGTAKPPSFLATSSSFFIVISMFLFFATMSSDEFKMDKKRDAAIPVSYTHLKTNPHPRGYHDSGN